FSLPAAVLDFVQRNSRRGTGCTSSVRANSRSAHNGVMCNDVAASSSRLFFSSRSRRSVAMPGTARAVDPEFPRLHRQVADRAAGSVTMGGDGTSLAPAERGFLVRLQRQALQYFLDNQVPGGLMLDRQHNHGPRRLHGLCSTTATGMGFVAL